jgi:hypothetical protein
MWLDGEEHGSLQPPTRPYVSWPPLGAPRQWKEQDRFSAAHTAVGKALIRLYDEPANPSENSLHRMTRGLQTCGPEVLSDPK